MKPLQIDERRIAKLADVADAADLMRGPGAKQARTEAYRALAIACNTALANALKSQGDS